MQWRFTIGDYFGRVSTQDTTPAAFPGDKPTRVDVAIGPSGDRTRELHLWDDGRVNGDPSEKESIYRCTMFAEAPLHARCRDCRYWHEAPSDLKKCQASGEEAFIFVPIFRNYWCLTMED